MSSHILGYWHTELGCSVPLLIKQFTEISENYLLDILRGKTDTKDVLLKNKYGNTPINENELRDHRSYKYPKHTNIHTCSLSTKVKVLP